MSKRPKLTPAEFHVITGDDKKPIETVSFDTAGKAMAHFADIIRPHGPKRKVVVVTDHPGNRVCLAMFDPHGLLPKHLEPHNYWDLIK